MWLYPYADDIHICDMLFICVTWRDAFKSLAGCCASSTCATWSVHKSCVPWLIHINPMCDVTHTYCSYVSRDAFTWLICVTWLIHSTHALLLILDLCAVTHSYYPYMRRDSFTRFIQVTRLIHIIHTCVYVCDTTHWHLSEFYTRHDMIPIGWQRWVGSLNV